MKRVFIALVILLLLTATAYAESAQTVIAESISPEEGVPPEAVEDIGTYENYAADTFFEKVLNLFRQAGDALTGTVRQGAASCGMILAAALLCGLSDASPSAGRAASIVGALAITAACTGNLKSMLGLGVETVEKVDHYFLLLLPGLTALAATSGFVSASSALSVGAVIFFKLLMSAIRVLVVPGIYLLAVLSAAEAALDNERLQKLRELISWALTWILKLSLYLFTGFLALTGLIGGTTDALRLKAAKLALSGTVPVVGGILSDASDAVLSSAATVKNAVGTYGLLAVLAVCLYPFLRLAVQYLMMKLTTALCGLIGKKCHTSLTEHLTGAVGLTLGIVGTYSIMILICITVFLKLAV